MSLENSPWDTSSLCAKSTKLNAWVAAEFENRDNLVGTLLCPSFLCDECLPVRKIDVPCTSSWIPHAISPQNFATAVHLGAKLNLIVWLKFGIPVQRSAAQYFVISRHRFENGRRRKKSWKIFRFNQHFRLIILHKFASSVAWSHLLRRAIGVSACLKSKLELTLTDRFSSLWSCRNPEKVGENEQELQKRKHVYFAEEKKNCYRNENFRNGYVTSCTRL